MSKVADHPQLFATCACGQQCTAKPAKDGGIKTPMRWRKIAGQYTCPACVKNAYYTRGFRVEIRGLADGSERDPIEFRRSLSSAAAASARFGNWLVQQLFLADSQIALPTTTTKDGKTKLHPCPTVDYYREATQRFPELAPASIVAAGKMVCGWYRSRRFDALVRLSRSVESYRFGSLPIEVPKQAWALKTNADGKFEIQTQVGAGASWRVKIYAAGVDMGRLKAIHAGDAIPLALKIVRASKRPIAGSGAPPQKAWFFRISAMFPRTTAIRRQLQEITLTLGHDAGALLFGSLEGSDDVFEFPGGELRRIIVGGDKSDRARQVQDSLARANWPKRKAQRWAKDRSRIAENRERKVKTQIQLAADSLARWCQSHGVTSVDYDTVDRGFLPHCPWQQLRQSIHNALEARGIALHVLAPESEAIPGPGSETNDG